jgi:hypothetical protein
MAVALAAVLAFPDQVATSAMGRAGLEVGPGRVLIAFPAASRTLELRIVPNRASVWNTLKLRIARNTVPQRGAHITVSMTMRAMQMGTQTFGLRESPTGTYSYAGARLVMAGIWDIRFRIAPSRGTPFTVHVQDRVGM